MDTDYCTPYEPNVRFRIIAGAALLSWLPLLTAGYLMF